MDLSREYPSNRVVEPVCRVVLGEEYCVAPDHLIEDIGIEQLPYVPIMSPYAETSFVLLLVFIAFLLSTLNKT